MNISTSSKPTDLFKTFPEFSKLTLADGQRYEQLIRDYPPTSCASFFNLMTWWNALNSCAVALLNGNVVISHWMPGNEKATGLSIVGTHKLDESICAIFDHLRNTGEPVRLVHVPEYVLNGLQYPELFSAKPEHSTDEYVHAVSKYSDLETMPRFRRFRVRKFSARYPEQAIEVKNLDLNEPGNRELLVECAKAWQETGILKNFVKYLDDAMVLALDNAEQLKTGNLCLFVNGALQAYVLFVPTVDQRYVTISHAVFSNELPYTLDYAVHRFAQWFAAKGAIYANLDSDMGITALRMLKLALGPDHYFRYYTITPAEGGVIND